MVKNILRQACLLAFLLLAGQSAFSGTAGNTSSTHDEHESGGGGNIYLYKITMPAAGNITKITFYGSASATTKNVKGLIYDDDGAGGIPATRLGVTAPTTLTTTNGWWDYTFATPVSVAAGNYWIGQICDADNVPLSVNTTGGGTEKTYQGDNYTTPSASLGAADATYTEDVCIYATYTDPDVSAPAAVTNFSAATSVTQGAIKLSWQAPGDDGMTGALLAGSTCHIQYSTWTVDVVWSTSSALGVNSFHIGFATSGVDPGTNVDYTLSSLQDGDTYYFRVWHADEASNWSEVSTGATNFAKGTTPPSPRTTYYIATDGNDANDGLSQGASFKTFQKAFNTMIGGDRLYILNGTYSTAAAVATGYIGRNDYPYVVLNSSNPPCGISLSSMTEICALNDGQVTIVGGLYLGGVAEMGKKNYIKIKGITFTPTNGSGGTIYNADYCTIKNCGFRHYSNDDFGGLEMGTNDHAQDCKFNLIEDCWVWVKNSRLAVSNYRANNNVWRRVVVRCDGGSGAYMEGSGNPNVGFTVYDSSNVSIQNMIVVDRLLGTGYSYADFATAQHTEGANYLGNNEWLGCISLNSMDAGLNFEADAIVEPSVKIENFVVWDSSWGSINIGAANNKITVKNATCGISKNGDDTFRIASISSATVANIISYNSSRYGVNGVDSTMELSYVDVYGSVSDAYNAATCSVGGLTSDPLTGSPAALKYLLKIEDGSVLDGTGLGGADYGATIVNKYGADGSRVGDTGYNTLTANSLWPYPNEGKIKSDMAADSNYGFAGDTSLTHYIWDYLGNGSPYDDPVVPSQRRNNQSSAVWF